MTNFYTPTSLVGGIRHQLGHMDRLSINKDVHHYFTFKGVES